MPTPEPTHPSSPARPSATDESLLAHFLRGDRDALGSLAARYERPMLGLADGILGGRSDLACDAVQETWVRVIRFGSGFGGRSSFKTWLYRILVNECRTTLKTTTTREDARHFLKLQLVKEPDAPARSHTQDETQAGLHTALAELAPEKREILLLCYHAGMTHETAADILEIPLGTLKSRLHSALTELRQALGEEAVA